MTNYRNDKWHISKHNPGLSFLDIDSLPYYEYIEIREILGNELKEQVKQNTAQKNQMAQMHKPSMSTPRLPKFKK